MSRWLMVTVAVIVVASAAVFGVRRWLINDHADPVPTQEAVDRFRASTPSTVTTATTPTTPVASTTSPPTPAGSVATTQQSEPPTSTVPSQTPAPGVYRYVTSGGEDIDALGGARHDYPAETTITVVTDGCGVRLRWDALQERYDEWSLCATTAGIELQPDGVQFHEFFSRSEREELVCDVGALLVPRDPTATERTEQRCLLAEDPWLPVWEVLERTTRPVEGADVDVTHVRMTITDDDEHWEHTTVDWYLDDEGLPVQVVADKASNSPTLVGDVVYHEKYELTLVSTTPIR